MDHLSEFKPLSKVTLPNVGDLPCSGLTLIVGPNSSGKSQLLRDLYSRLCGEPRALVVALEVGVNKPDDFKSFISCLESEGYVETFLDDNNQTHLRPRTIFSGTGQPVPPLQSTQAEGLYRSFDQTPQLNQRRLHAFLNHFGRMLVTGLFLDRRLNVLNSIGLINFEQQPPQHDLHVLHTNDAARQELLREISQSFGRAVWTDMSSGNLLCLRVCDGALPSAEDRHSVVKMSKFRTIEAEGDGLKSYIAICIALLLGRRPVCIIDEPEMCLHPPQAYNLGRFIGRHGSSKDAATFVATHSSQILRGVVQSNRQVEIIRLTRRDDVFSAHRLAADELVTALNKPTLRAESVLDGIFSELVVVLEADSDRLVYHTAWETLSNEVRLDVHFAAVGGTGGIADICKLYRTLNIPVAIIADLDLAVDLDKLRRILSSLVSAAEAEPIIEKARVVGEEIRKCPPTIDPSDFKQRLIEINGLATTWENNDDIKIRQELRKLSQELDRMRRLKTGGIFQTSGIISGQLEALVSSLRAVGLFLVPVGELEGWLASEEITELKSNKAAWATAAALKIQSSGTTNGDIWDFLRGVAAYLRERSNNASTR